MKTKTLSIVALFMFGAMSLFAQTKTGKFKVKGTCTTCEARIENAALAVNGVKSAEWIKETMMLSINYDSSNTDILSIHEAIAKAGHDTELLTATPEAYNALHYCCKYTRGASIPSAAGGHEGHNH